MRYDLVAKYSTPQITSNHDGSSAVPPRTIQTVRTRHYVELRQGGIVLSRLPYRPAATHTPLDVVAAAAVALKSCPSAPTSRLAVLGFAAGGVVAPLRALLDTAPIDGVDLSASAFEVFRGIAASWSAPIRLHTADATVWLKRRRAKFAAIVDDLSEERDGTITKPWESIFALPDLCVGKLAPGGVAITNVLPFPGATWRALLGNLAAPFSSALVVELKDFENRILICGAALPTARRASVELRRALQKIGSRQVGRFGVRTLKSR